MCGIIIFMLCFECGSVRFFGIRILEFGGIMKLFCVWIL